MLVAAVRALEPRRRCRFRPLQGAAARCLWPCAVWSVAWCMLTKIVFPQTVYCWGSILEKKELGTLTGRAPELCGRALSPVVLLLSFSCASLVLLLSFFCPPPLVLLLSSSFPSLVLLGGPRSKKGPICL